ncbi:MAG: hypothetical protein C0511_09250 [Hyphomicrobium sp.]|nr:hypothetical protein [Hyphomicrobium sp.]
MAELKTKPNGIYYLDVRLPDESGDLKRTRVSLDTRDRAEAEGQRRQWLAGTHPKHPARGGVIAPKGRAERDDPSIKRSVIPTGMTVERWLWGCLDTVWNASKDVVKDDKGHRSNVRVLCRNLPEGLLLADVNADHVSELADALWKQGYKPGSVKKLMNALSRALNHATRTIDRETGRPYLAARPLFPEIKVKNTKDRVITMDEEQVIHDCIDQRIDDEPLQHWWEFKMLMLVLADTGFRMGEALQLGPGSINRQRWQDALTGQDQEGTFLMLGRYTTKNDKPRQVPVTERLLRLIPTLNARAKGGRWFPWQPGSNTPLRYLGFIKQDVKRRGYSIDDVTLHTWRHTCATRLAQGGMDLIALRDWLGHGDIKITAGRYIHLMVGHIHRGTSILDTFNGTRSSAPRLEAVGE